MGVLVSFLIVIEIIAFILGIFLIIRKRGDSIPMSFSYSAVLTLATLSLSIQFFFLLGIPGVYFFFDIAIIVFSAFHIINNKDIIKKDTQRVFNFLKKNKSVVFLMIPILTYLFLQAFLVPPGNMDSMVYNLARVLMFKQEGSLFLENFSPMHQAAFPVGYDSLSFLFLRFNSDFGLATFSFMSYIIIIIGTFSFVRCFYDKKMGVNISIIIASLTEIVLQATTTKNDIPIAAVVVVIFLSGHHFIISRKSLPLYVLIVSLLWGLTIKGYFAGFALPFILFYSILLIKNFSFSGLFKLISINRIKFNYKFMLPLGLIICMTVFYGNNIKRFGTVFGEKKFVQCHQNKDGLLGGMINAGRYLLQSAEIPLKYGYKINEIHDNFLKENKSKGMLRKIKKIDLAGKTFISEDHSWYGPLGILLIIPSIFYCACFGKGYIRVVSLTLLSYFIILSYKIVWMPWNNRFFSLFFAGSGICIAAVFNRFLHKNKGVIKGLKGFIVLIAIYSLLSATLQNDRISTIPKYGSVNLFHNLYKLGSGVFNRNSPGKRCFPWLKYISDRKSHYERYLPKGMLNAFISSVGKGKKVILMVSFAPIFPLLLLRPDLDITVSKGGWVTLNNKAYNLNKKKDYMYIREKYDYIIFININMKKFKICEYSQDEDQVFYSKKGSIFHFKR